MAPLRTELSIPRIYDTDTTAGKVLCITGRDNRIVRFGNGGNELHLQWISDSRDLSFANGFLQNVLQIGYQRQGHGHKIPAQKSPLPLDRVFASGDHQADAEHQITFRLPTCYRPMHRLRPQLQAS